MLNNTISNLSYKVGIYVRLSREDEDSYKKESESITNQKEFLLNYVQKKEWKVEKIYSDDGYSGTSFERPAFRELLKDIENKKINLVITKDLSRLGRNYSKTGYYIDEYFPEHQIRYIAVNDNVDTFEGSGNGMTGFMAVVNDMYARDSSIKVRTAFKTKQEKGEYLGTSPPFGYNKDKNTKGKLVIDLCSSVYVKRIFNEFLGGKPIHKIMLEFTNEKIPTPSQYLKIKNTQKIIKGAWSDVTISRILKNEVYIGHTIQNKKQKVNYKVKKQKCVPKEEWIRVENTHQPLIPLKDFDMVQQILKNRSYVPKVGTTHLLTGFLFCGNCGSRITFIKRHEKGKFYCLCNVAKNFRKLGKCDMNSVNEEDVENEVKKILTNIANKYLNKDDLIKSTYTEQMEMILKDMKQEKELIDLRIKENNTLQYNLYKDKTLNTIDNDTYLLLKNQAISEKSVYEQRLITLEQEIEKLNNASLNNKLITDILNDYLKFESLDRNILSMLIDKIILYKNDNRKNIFEIYCKFQNPS
ncbi:MAG: recombinase family protein [Clostridia bacterium]